MEKIERKLTPTEFIESAETGNSTSERIYRRSKGKMIDITGKQYDYSVAINQEKANEIKGVYTSLHTHPIIAEKLNEFPNLPSRHDFGGFLKTPQEKTMIIAQRDPITGKVAGYYFFKKNKKTVHVPTFKEMLLENKKLQYKDYLQMPLIKDLTDYDEKFINIYKRKEEQGEDLTNEEYHNLVNGIVKKYGLKYRCVPVKGYKIKKGLGFIKAGGLESEVLSNAAAIVSISSSLIALMFLSSNLTGNAIANLSISTSNIIGATCFLISIIGYLVYFKKKKNN